jgi:hypothetical protein
VVVFGTAGNGVGTVLLKGGAAVTAVTFLPEESPAEVDVDVCFKFGNGFDLVDADSIFLSVVVLVEKGDEVVLAGTEKLALGNDIFEGIVVFLGTPKDDVEDGVLTAVVVVVFGDTPNGCWLDACVLLALLPLESDAYKESVFSTVLFAFAGDEK